MICATCHGTGTLAIHDCAGECIGVRVCSDCGGNGTGYCCEGAPYDWEADAKGCWALAIEVIGARVRAGEPVPEFFRSTKRGPVE